MSYFRQQLEDWLKTIDVKADRALDIGGGANPVKGRTKSWEVKEYRILDNKLEKMKQKPDYVCDINQPIFANIVVQDISDDKRFDVIFCLEVMEYVWNPHSALLNIAFMLNKNGILYISFPFLYPHHNPKGYDYLRYTRWGVKKLLEETGFKILELKSRKMYNKSYAYWREFMRIEKMHPCKDYDGHIETGYLVKAKRI